MNLLNFMQNLENQTEQNLLKNNVERNNKYRIYLHMYELTMIGNLYLDSLIFTGIQFI